LRRINVGVLGVGNMGKNHVRIYSQLSHLVNLVGIYDHDSCKRDIVCAEYNTKFFDSMEKLLDQVDAVSIAVPSSLHYSCAMKCFERGIHVLVEKPIALNQDQGASMVEASKKASVVLLVGHVERYNPAAQALKKMLLNEEIVALDFRRLSPYDLRISDTDVIQDLMIHDIDVLNYLIGSPLVSLEAYGLKMKANHLIDHAVAIGHTECNKIVSLTASRVTEQKVRKLFVTAKSTYIEMDYLERKLTISRRTDLCNYLSEKVINYRQESLMETVLVPNTEPLLAEIMDFINCINSKSMPIASGEAGLTALKVASEIQAKVKLHELHHL